MSLVQGAALNLPAKPVRDIERNAFDDPGALDVVQAMIQMIYQAAVDPDRFEDLLETWDAFYARAASSANFLLLAEHFEQALVIAADPQLDRRQHLTVILDMVAGPAILVDENGTLVQANALGAGLFADIATEGSIAARFDGPWQPGSQTDTRHFTIKLREDEILLAASRRIPLPGAEGAHFLIRLSSPGWTPQLTQTLTQNYGLTEAEVSVAQLLYEGCSAVEIADARGRSLETVRTQIKSVMTKTDTRKQTGFVQFLSHLQYVVGAPEPVRAPVPAQKEPANGDVATREITASCGRKLKIAEYGDPRGIPLVYFTTSSRPAETEDWRILMAEAGFRVIAPHRPGFGGSDQVGLWDKTAAFLTDICRDHLGLSAKTPPLFVGHREGGILGADVAARLGSALPVQDVVMISTGVPGVHADSHAIARSSRAIHVLPAALRLGYRTARRVYLSGDLGAEQILAFFIKDSPIDQMQIRSPGVKAALHANLAYCFENTDAIVDDVARWTSDWASPLRQAAPQITWHFIHGAAHDFMTLADVAAHCDRAEGCRLATIENAAQMLLYAHTRRVVAEIAALR